MGCAPIDSKFMAFLSKLLQRQKHYVFVLSNLELDLSVNCAFCSISNYALCSLLLFF